MKYLLLLSLFSTQAFSQAPKHPLEEMFKDVPLEQRQDKRIEFATRMFSDNNDTGYSRDLTPILYSLNLKENPKHAISWYYLVNKLLSQGEIGNFKYTPEVTNKADQLLTQALQNVPDYGPLLVRRAYLDVAMKKDKETIRQNVSRINEYGTGMDFSSLAALGETLFWVGENQKAASVYKLLEAKATTKEERESVPAYRAQGAMLGGNYQECVDGYKQARAFRKSYGEDANLISCLNSLKKYDEALAIANEHKSTSGQGGFMDCHVGASNAGKGHQLYEAGNHYGAEPFLLESLKGCKDSNRYNKLAFNYIKLNNLDKAKETILEGAKIHDGNKASYLSGWSTYFKDNNNLKFFFHEEALKQITVPKDKLDANIQMMFSLKNANDPAFVEFSRKAIASGEEIYQANRNDFEVVKYYGAMNTVFGVKRDSLIYLGKAREILNNAKSIRPGHDPQIEQNLAVITEIENGIRAGKIQPSEP